MQRWLRLGKALLWPAKRLANRQPCLGGALGAASGDAGDDLAQVFLSYARGDAAKARPIAAAIERAGHSVWWDGRIEGGTQYANVIEEALTAAQVVVVLWSAEAVESHWVRDEAAAGRDTGRLVPLSLDGTEPPLGFRQYQTMDLSGGSARWKSAQLKEVVKTVASVASGTRAQASPAKRRPRTPEGFTAALLARPWRLIALIIGLGILSLGLIISRPWERRSHGTYTVAVTSADNDAGRMARDLLVSLGTLQSASSGAVRLVGDPNGSTRADLLFQASRDDSSDNANGSLVLLDGKDRSVLWSEQFNQPSGKLADLQQQIAFTAARVLQCALDGKNAPDGGLGVQTLKLYLTGCSRTAELANSDPSPIIPILEKVVADAPRFAAGWGMLLTAQTSVAEGAFTDSPEDKAQKQKLERLIAEARQVNQNLAEATIAEVSLLPPRDYSKTLGLADRAIARNPGNAAILSIRADLLGRVGRMQEAIGDARQAATLDPLSPLTRSAYVSSLLYGGQMATARQELAKAEQLWPGTDTVIELQYRFHLRYGDPKEALQIMQSQGIADGNLLFLKARIDPSPTNLNGLRTFINTRIYKRGATGLPFYVQAAGQFGWKEDLFKLLLSWPEPRDIGTIAGVFFRPALHDVRTDPRFMLVAKRAGLIDYWQKSGKWPDYCSDVNLRYDCKVEAAKLG